jgi:hypothetical protein
VHFDALGREIAKLAEGYDGRWSRTAVGYDPVGLKVAEYGPHWVVNDPAGPERRGYRQGTVERDIMHRPVLVPARVKVVVASIMQPSAEYAARWQPSC